MHAGEQVGIHHVVRVAVDDGLLVLLGGPGLLGGDEGRTDVGKVRPHRLGGQDGAARGHGTRQRQRAVEPLADFLDQGKRALHAGMAASARRHGDQAVRALLDGLVGELVVDDVVHHHAAPAVHGLVHVLARAQAGDDQRHLVLGADLQVVLQAVVALVHDLVDGKRGGRRFRVRPVVRGQLFGDLGQPVLQHFRRAGIQGGHGTHDTGLALGNDQLGVADDEQGRADHGQCQVLQHCRNFGHATVSESIVIDRKTASNADQTSASSSLF